MNNCKHLKIKLNRQLECRKTNKLISFKDCKNCPYKEYKQSSSSSLQNSAKTPQKMKKRSNKLAKLERNRTSLFTEDLDHCIICGKKKEHLHEVFSGRNRINSIKYKMVLPLCAKHHEEMHSNINLADFYKKKGQVIFEKTYPDLKFEDIFRKNYK